jgi:hypothetical protein
VQLRHCFKRHVCLCNTRCSITGTSGCVVQLRHCFKRHVCHRNVPLMMSRIACPYVTSCQRLPRKEETNHVISFKIFFLGNVNIVTYYEIVKMECSATDDICNTINCVVPMNNHVCVDVVHFLRCNITFR